MNKKEIDETILAIKKKMAEDDERYAVKRPVTMEMKGGVALDGKAYAGTTGKD